MNPLHSFVVESPNAVEESKDHGLDEMEMAAKSSSKVSRDSQLNTTDNMIFDSVAVQFRPNIFWFQLFIHIFLFFAPFSPNPLAQQFRGSNSWPIFYDIILPIVLYLMIISYALSPASSLRIMSGAVWIPLIYFIQHKLIVALKYASLSPSEYERFMQCKDPALLNVYRSQLQLIAAWLNRDEKVLEFELGAAAVRIGAKISDIYFLLPNPKSSLLAQSQLHYWHAFLRGRALVDFNVQDTIGLQLRSDGKYQLSVYDLCTALIRRCDTMDFGQRMVFNLIFLFNLITFLIPFAVLAAFYNSQTDFSFWIVIFYFCSTVITFFFGNIVYNLLYVAIFDVLRQLRMIDELTSLIRLSDLSLDPVNDSFDGYLNDRFSIGRKNLEAILNLNKPSCEGQLAAAGDINRAPPSTTPVLSNNLALTRVEELMRQSSAARRMTTVNDATDGSMMECSLSNDIRYSEIGERWAQDQGVAELPKISFDELPNIIAWTYARLVLQNFGDRFRFRIDIYVGGTITILLLLVIAALAMAFTLQDTTTAFESSFFLQALITITMIFAFLIIITYASSVINDKLGAHKQLLSRHILRYRNKLQRIRATRRIQKEKKSQASMKQEDDASLGTSGEEDEVENIINQIEAVSDVLQTEKELKPFKVFGIEATSSLTMTVITTFISFLGIVISLFTNNTSPIGQSLTAV